MVIGFKNEDITTDNLTSAISASGRNERTVESSNSGTVGIPILIWFSQFYFLTTWHIRSSLTEGLISQDMFRNPAYHISPWRVMKQMSIFK